MRSDNLYAYLRYDDDEQCLKCWYNPFIDDEITEITLPAQRAWAPYKVTIPREMGVCYATFRDGIECEKPALGLHEVRGSIDNNVMTTKQTRGDSHDHT